MRTSYLLFFIFYCHCSFCQITERFSDGELSRAPEWTGDTSAFIINSGFELQSNGPSASSVISMSTASTGVRNTTWEFYVRLEFEPSPSNYARIYLCSDNQDLEGSLQGYFIKIGGESGTNDGIDLYRQDGFALTKIIDGVAGHAAKERNALRVKVMCDGQGRWQMFSDTTGGTHFSPEGAAEDNAMVASSWSGISFVHSSTRRNLFYFDDFIVSSAPLEITHVAAAGDSSLTVHFNLPPDSLQAVDPAAYFLKGYGAPSDVQGTAGMETIILKFPHAIRSGACELQVSGLYEGGKALGPFIVPFRYLRPLRYGDIVINEILPDPDPSAGLPAYEFAELYNTTADTIDLASFVFSDPATRAALPSFHLLPHSCLVLTPAEALPLFLPYGKCIGLAPWPSLNNTGDTLRLFSPEGQLIFELPYSGQWHDPVKQDGGWSLEMVNPSEYCKGAAGWRSAVDPAGGTPGLVNSVYSATPDSTAPRLVSFSVIDSVSVQLYFDEAPAATTALFDLPGNELDAVVSTGLSSLVLSFTAPFSPGEETVITMHNIADCLGNRREAIQLRFIRPEEAGQGDIIINEVLFNPRPEGVDFVELFNKSGKYIDLRNWQLGSYRNDSVPDLKYISDSSLILKPYDYLVVTTSLRLLQQQYSVPFPRKIREIKSMPSYPDKEGTVILSDSRGKMIDRFDYREDLHSPLLKDPEGVSLERISFYAPTGSAANWHSAAMTAGFATPGFENSEHVEAGASAGIELDPAVITPNGDNFRDLLFIRYRFSEPGNVCSFIIFSSDGRQVRQIARNEAAGTEGFFYWDGTDDQGRLVNTGIYIVLGTVFNLQGKETAFKKTVVVANGF